MNRVRGFEIVVDEKRKTTGEITLPTAGTSKAMAYDFYSTDEWHAAPNAVVKVWTDVKAYMQENECLIINVRSSMGGKFMLANTSGWIDADYYSNEGNDGNIGVFLKNILVLLYLLRLRAYPIFLQRYVLKDNPAQLYLQ